MWILPIWEIMTKDLQLNLCPLLFANQLFHNNQLFAANQLFSAHSVFPFTLVVDYSRLTFSPLIIWISIEFIELPTADPVCKDPKIDRWCRLSVEIIHGYCILLSACLPTWSLLFSLSLSLSLSVISIWIFINQISPMTKTKKKPALPNLNLCPH